MELTKKRITVFLDTNANVSRAPDDNPRVHLRRNQTILVDRVEPEPANGRNGAMLNVPGNAQLLAFDSRDHPTRYAKRVGATFPLECRIGDTLIVSLSAPERVEETRSRSEYWDVPGRSWIDEMMCISFVGRDTTPAFRTFGIGANALLKRLRKHIVPLTQLQLRKLPSVFDLDRIAAEGAQLPPLAYLEGLFSDFCGEVCDGWSTDTLTPDLQHPGYGRDLASVVSQALVVLCSTLPLEQKRKLATLMVQWGIDLAGAWLDGRVNMPAGGHCQGRKALIILAGFLLNIREMTDPDRYLGGQGAFQESRAYYYREPAAWFWSGAKFGWRFKPANEQPEFTHNPPQMWTTEHQTGNQHRSEEFAIKGYLEHCCGSQVGTALAMKTLGLERQMGRNFTGMIAQWMAGPPPAERQLLEAGGYVLPWGRGFELVQGQRFCETAWRLYS